MKLVVVTEGKKRTIPLPMKTVLGAFLSKAETLEEKKRIKKFLKEAASCLKAYKKECGSFVLLDAEEKDERVQIIV